MDTVFSDVMDDALGRGLTITCAAPFFDENNELAGVIGMDVLIKDLYDEVVDMNLGEGAYAFMIDGNGNIISPENEELSIYDSTDLTEDEIATLLSGETGVLLAGNGVYYGYTPVDTVGWTLCTYLPASLVLEPATAMDQGINQTVIVFVVIAVLILVIVIFVVGAFSKTLTDPLIALRNDVKTISGGNLDYRAKVAVNDEIGDLAEEFNSMAASLQKHIDDVKRVTRENERIGAELDVARRIQADMLPSKFPAFPDHSEFDIYALMTPAKEVGGDFYDFFLIDDSHLALVMADVSGKGVPAALFMVTTRTLLKNRAISGGTPADILASVNNELYENNEQELFVTTFLGILDLKSGDLIYASAGHEYPGLRDADGKYRLVRSEAYPPLATEENLVYANEHLTMTAGSMLFLYTDGVPDAKSPSKKRYGLDQMLNRLNQTDTDSPKELLTTLKADVDAFAGEGDPFDDITMLALRFIS